MLAILSFVGSRELTVCAGEMMEKLPEWPEKIVYELHDRYVWASNNPLTTMGIVDYERARAEAAIARLKVAVTALNRIAAVYDWNDARDALAAIGPIEQGE